MQFEGFAGNAALKTALSAAFSRAAGCRILFFYRVKRGLANAH